MEPMLAVPQGALGPKTGLGFNYLNLNLFLWYIPVADFEAPDIMNSILNIITMIVLSLENF